MLELILFTLLLIVILYIFLFAILVLIKYLKNNVEDLELYKNKDGSVKNE